MSIPSRAPFNLLVLLVTVFAFSDWAICAAEDASNDEKAEASAPEADQEVESAAERSDGAVEEPPAEKDRYALPDGGVDELLAFIKEIEAFRPRNIKDYLAHRDKSPVALKAAAEAILEKKPHEDSEAHQTAAFVLLKVKAEGITRMQPDQQREMLKELLDAFASRKQGPKELSLAMSVARGLEYSSSQELAVEAYEGLGGLLAKSDDPQVVNYADMLLGSARRIQLVGNAMELAGTKMDGTAFDLADLKGKVVLVDFWATWCGPCRAEHPNIKKNYDLYHDHGFDVVGVSLDQNRQVLEKYVEEEHVAWTTLHEADNGGKNPATAYYGISGIPTMILVGRDGNVLSTRARGGELNRLLAEQFPDVKVTDETEAESAAEAADETSS
jgi:thiol-disulfide isomerase/thioredoxin